jgi:hypothetical protein
VIAEPLLLYEREKSLLPGTQGLVKIEKAMARKEIDDILDDECTYKL